ncbi:MAG TPA: hypothetical protein VFP61_01970 [Acidimicrobiales bacterium]|nr:hypothetical protein [Acidimicrobiales bacterium]
MADAGHQLLGRDAGHAGDEGGGVVAQVVHVQPWRCPDVSHCGPPGLRQFGSPERPATGAGEHHAVVAGLRERGEVARQRVCGQRRQGDGAPAGVGLRVEGDAAEPGDLVRRLSDRDGATVEVDVAAGEAEHLGGAQADEPGEQHEGTQPGGHGVGEVEHHGRGDQRALPGLVDAGAAHAARVARQQAVVCGGVQHGAQEAVALSSLVSADLRRHLGVPVAHQLGSDLPEGERPEGRQDAAPQLGPVALHGGGGEGSPLHQPGGQPPLDVAGEDGRCGRVLDDDADELVAVDLAPPCVGVVAPAERLGALGAVGETPAHVVAQRPVGRPTPGDAGHWRLLASFVVSRSGRAGSCRQLLLHVGDVLWVVAPPIAFE